MYRSTNSYHISYEHVFTIAYNLALTKFHIFSSLISLLTSMLASHHNICHRLQTQVRYFNFIRHIHRCAFQNEIIYGTYVDTKNFICLHFWRMSLYVCLLGICVCMCMKLYI